MKEGRGREGVDLEEEAVARRGGLEAARILARYRRLILLGRLRAPLETARRLVGPDCAYRLYGQLPAPAVRRLPRLKGRGRRSARRPAHPGRGASPR